MSCDNHMQVANMSPLTQQYQINCKLTVDEEDIGWDLLSYLEVYLLILPTVNVISSEGEDLHKGEQVAVTAHNIEPSLTLQL